MIEVDYYPELSEVLENTIKANVNDPNIHIKALYLPEYGSNIRSFLAKYLGEQGVVASDTLKRYAEDVPKLRTDIIVVLDNPKTNKFQIIVVEAKLLGSAGLTELSQLIGYCLVTKASHGLLINVNGGASNELTTILNQDLDLTKIERKLTHEPFETTHKIGVMTYSSETRNISYIPTSALKSLPQVIQEIVEAIG